MIPVLTPSEMAGVDRSAPEPVEVLVERAGHAVAAAARRLLGGTYGKRVVVVAGPGNNGADGRVAARRLKTWGSAVEVLDVTEAVRNKVLPAHELLGTEAAKRVLSGYRTRYSALSDAVTETEPAFDDSRLGQEPIVDLLTEPVYALAARWRSR